MRILSLSISKWKTSLSKISSPTTTASPHATTYLPHAPCQASKTPTPTLSPPHHPETIRPVPQTSRYSTSPLAPARPTPPRNTPAQTTRFQSSCPTTSTPLAAPPNSTALHHPTRLSRSALRASATPPQCARCRTPHHPTTTLPPHPSPPKARTLRATPSSNSLPPRERGLLARSVRPRNLHPRPSAQRQ